MRALEEQSQGSLQVDYSLVSRAIQLKQAYGKRHIKKDMEGLCFQSSGSSFLRLFLIRHKQSSPGLLNTHKSLSSRKLRVPVELHAWLGFLLFLRYPVLTAPRDTQWLDFCSMRWGRQPTSAPGVRAGDLTLYATEQFCLCTWIFLE